MPLRYEEYVTGSRKKREGQRKWTEEHLRVPGRGQSKVLGTSGVCPQAKFSGGLAIPVPIAVRLAWILLCGDPYSMPEDLPL